MKDTEYLGEDHSLSETPLAPTQNTRQGFEAAFREGYQCGYANGCSDAVAYEWGAGSKHAVHLKKDQDEAWNDNEANSMTATSRPKSTQ